MTSEPHTNNFNSQPQEVGGLFRLGRPDTHFDVQHGETRHISWRQSNDDGTFAPIAGWESLAKQGSSGPYLEIPRGTRSAASVLSGTPAFPGEKEGVVEAFLHYLRQSVTQASAIDVGVDLSTLAVTRGEDRRFVMLPPHTATTEQPVIAAWIDTVTTDIRHILAPSQEEGLAEAFQAKAMEIVAQL